MKKIILLAVFAFLTACSSDEWSPVLVEDETVESSSDAVELSSSSVEPVIESSSETVVESSSSIVTVSSSSVETVESSSSYDGNGDVCVTEECAAEYCKEAYNDKIINCETAYIYDCEKYLHDECWE